MESLPPFPAPHRPASRTYTALEHWVDRSVHLAGLAAALFAAAWLLRRIGPHGSPAQIFAIQVYSAGLVSMIGASTIYHFARPGRWKAMFRRLDHSMIFVMIAGSYMPYAFLALPPEAGRPLAIAIWSLAAAGIILKFAYWGRGEKMFLALYLAMGWMFVMVAPSLVDRLPTSVLLLLLGGGIVYSLGSLVHASARIPFHNAIWHSMVLTAASLHFVAVIQLVPAS